MTPPTGPTKARAPEYRQAGTKINKPLGKAEEYTETGPPAPGSPNTVKAAREGREGRKKSATTGLLTPIPNVNKRKKKDGGGKERI